MAYNLQESTVAAQTPQEFQNYVNTNYGLSLTESQAALAQQELLGLITNPANNTGQMNLFNVTTGPLDGEGNPLYYNFDFQAAPHQEIQAGPGQDTIFGTDGDTIHGSNDPNGGAIIHADWGKETVEGGAGNDTITGGELRGTQTVIHAGSGNDSIVSGAGNTSVSLGSGNDTFTAGSGNATVALGSGHDTVYGGPGTTEVDASKALFPQMNGDQFIGQDTAGYNIFHLTDLSTNDVNIQTNGNVTTVSFNGSTVILTNVNVIVGQDSTDVHRLT